MEDNFFLEYLKIVKLLKKFEPLWTTPLRVLPVYTCVCWPFLRQFYQSCHFWYCHCHAKSVKLSDYWRSSHQLGLGVRLQIGRFAWWFN